jgi:hypothetical protein
MPVKFDSVKSITAAIVLLGTITVSHAENAGIHISVLRTKTAEGTGSLFFRTRRYRLRVSGIDTKHANVEKIELAGSALGLQNTGDIVGTYGPAASGTTIVSASKAARLQNGGVTLELHANNVGMPALDLAGMTISSHGVASGRQSRFASEMMRFKMLFVSNRVTATRASCRCLPVGLRENRRFEIRSYIHEISDAFPKTHKAL